MKFLFYFLLFPAIFCFYQCNNSQPDLLLNGNISHDVNALLEDGNSEIMIMDSIVQTPREIELSFRMQKAVESNDEWYRQWAIHYRQLPVLPYHPNFGLSKAEYNELMEMKKNKNLTHSAIHKITVINKEGQISFDTRGSIPYLDKLKFDAKENTVAMENYILRFRDTLFIANENHGLKSMWKGYSWRYDEPNENDTTSDQWNTKHYSITLAQLYKSGKTLLLFSKLEDVEGERTLNFEKALILQKD